MSDLQAYLASKYLSGAKADAIIARAEQEDGVKRKKKKRKVDQGGERIVAPGGGLVIDDKDGMGWARRKQEEEEEDGRPVVEERRGHFKASKATAWATVRPPDPKTPSPEPDDEDPFVVSTTQDLAPPPVPVARGGLQSSADLRRENERRLAEQEAKRVKNEKELALRKKERQDRGEEGEDDEDPHATVYRDSQGRRIDVKLEKAEKAKMEREKLEKEMKKMEWGKGLVQKEDKEARKREELRIAAKPIARYADDEDMNNAMKDQERWNDPAANFLSKKKSSSSSAPKYPRYAGPPPPPNRFGIPPGYRWDGVDRGNGFESKLMQRGNQNKMRQAEAHAWRTDDM